MSEDRNNITRSFEKGVFRDSIPSQQPDGTARLIRNGVYYSDEHDGNILANSPGNQLEAELPLGYILRGERHVPERDLFIVFIYNQLEKVSEIGIISDNYKTYRGLFNDSHLDDKLEFGREWIDIEYKLMDIGTCSHLIVYWSNNNFYRRIDLDAKIQPDLIRELDLIKTACIPKAKVYTAPTGGTDTLSGSYQFAFQLEDNDKNTTNISYPTEPVSLGSENNIAGEISRESIYVELSDLDAAYDKVNIFLIKTIGGVVTANLIKTLPYNTNGITYHYTGTTGREEAVPLEEITVKHNHYIKGKHLIQYKGRLTLYNVLGEENINLQPIVENAEVSYVIKRVPATEAHKYKNFMGDEVYALGIVPNYIDGTSGNAIHLYGRESEGNENDIIDDPDYPNCSECEKPLWALKNTAKRTEIYCPNEENLFDISESSRKPWVHTSEPFEDPYPEDEDYLQTLQDANDELQNELEQAAKDATEEFDEVAAQTEECDPCFDGLSELNCNFLREMCLAGSPYHCQLYQSTCENELDCTSLQNLYNTTTNPFLRNLLRRMLITRGCIDPEEPIDCSTVQCKSMGQVIATCPPGCDCSSTEIHGAAFCQPDTSAMQAASRSLTCPSGNCPDTTSERCPGGQCGQNLSCRSGRCPGTGCSTCGGGGSYTSLGVQTSNTNTEDALQNCVPEPIYDPDGCSIIGYKPLLYVKGKMGYWESKQTYPTTRDCDGNFIYGKNAGRPIRHHRMPDRTLEPHFVSYQTGVVNAKQPENHEWNHTFVHLIGVHICKIAIPDKLPKPLCPHNPFSLVYVRRDSSNKSIQAKGLFIDTFKGQVFGEDFAIPKHAVNSLEFFDRYIYERVLNRPERVGMKNEAGGYIFHSPDTNILKPALVSQEVKIELELNGEGIRHGLYEEGLPTNNWLIPAIHQRGTRQSIHLNRYTLPARVSVTPGTGGGGGNGEIEECDTISFTVTQEITQVTSQGTGIGIRVVWDLQGPSDFSGNINIRTIGIGDCISEGFTSPVSSFPLNRVYTNLPPDCGDINYTFQITVTGSLPNGCEYTDSFALNTPVGATDAHTSQNIQATNNPFEGDPDDPEDPTEVILESEGSMVGCLKAISYANSDTIVDKAGLFTYSLLNLYRESSVYLELREDQDKFTLRNGIDRYLSDGVYNGDVDIVADGTSDGSFLGDAYVHDTKIHNAAGWYGSLKREMPSQYGRLESLQYIKTGIEFTNADMLCGSIEGLGGDTFVNMYSVKRTAYVSDHVGDSIIRPATLKNMLKDMTLNLSFSRRVRKLLTAIISLLISVISKFLGPTDGFGVDSCGKVPETQDEQDPRNYAGLRQFNNTTWNGESAFQGRGSGAAVHNNRRVYYPGVLSTLVTFWVESEVNTYYRETGENPDDNYYPKLKGQVVDSTLRRNSGFKIGWLNRFYLELKEVEAWKKYIIILLNILVKIAFPIWAIFKIIGIVSQLPAPGGFSGIVGIVLTVLLALFIFLVLVGFFALVWMALLYFVNHQLLILLGVDQCRTDSSKKKFSDGSVRGFEDNYHFYNYDHSRVNDLAYFYGYPDPMYTCLCDNYLKELIFSNPQIHGSPIDAYRNFKINNYLAIPTHSGDLQEIFIQKGNMFLHTTNGMYVLGGAERTMEMSLEKIVLGSPDFITDPNEMFGGIPEGFAGLSDQNSAYNSRFGRVFIDRKAKELYLFSEEFEPLIKEGMYSFMKEYLDFALLEDFPEFELVDLKLPNGVGYAMGIHGRSSYLYVTKRDFRPIKEGIELRHGTEFYNKEGIPIELTDAKYFQDVSFTFAIDMRRRTFIGIFDFLPIVYMNTRSDLWMSIAKDFWRQLTKGNYCTYFGKQYPFIVDAPLASMINFRPKFLQFDTETFRITPDGKIRGEKLTFSHIAMYNTRETTGVKNLVFIRDNSALESIQETNDIRVVQSNGLYRIQDFRDYTLSIDNPIFKNSSIFEDLILNETGSHTGHLLHDKILNVRLIWDENQDNNVSIKIKYLILTVDYDQE